MNFEDLVAVQFLIGALHFLLQNLELGLRLEHRAIEQSHLAVDQQPLKEADMAGLELVHTIQHGDPSVQRGAHQWSKLPDRVSVLLSHSPLQQVTRGHVRIEVHSMHVMVVAQQPCKLVHQARLAVPILGDQADVVAHDVVHNHRVEDLREVGLAGELLVGCALQLVIHHQGAGGGYPSAVRGAPAGYRHRDLAAIPSSRDHCDLGGTVGANRDRLGVIAVLRPPVEIILLHAFSRGERKLGEDVLEHLSLALILAADQRERVHMHQRRCRRHLRKLLQHARPLDGLQFRKVHKHPGRVLVRHCRVDLPQGLHEADQRLDRLKGDRRGRPLQPSQQLRRGQRGDSQALESRAQRRVQWGSRVQRNGKPKSDHAEVRGDPHEAHLVHLFLAILLPQLVVPSGVHEKAAIIQGHLSVLQQVIQHREHVALGLLDTLQQKNASVHRRIDRGLVNPQHISPRDLATDLDVGLRGIPGDAQELHLLVHQLAVPQRQPPPQGPWRSHQEDILPHGVLLHHPPQLLEDDLGVHQVLKLRYAEGLVVLRDGHAGVMDGHRAEGPTGMKPQCPLPLNCGTSQEVAHSSVDARFWRSATQRSKTEVMEKKGEKRREPEKMIT
eukprot:RCo015882